jgi:hypothetical protein
MATGLTSPLGAVRERAEALLRTSSVSCNASATTSSQAVPRIPGPSLLHRWFYESHERVYAVFEWLRDAPCVVKNVALVGFEGTFVTNLELPDNLALGRSVSHGYGWFRRMGA